MTLTLLPHTWYPIELLPTIGDGHRDHGLSIYVHDPELINLDANPHGISEAYWQDDGIAGETNPGAFLGLRYDMCSDEWDKVELNPTHFMIVVGPNPAEDQLEVLRDSWKSIGDLRV